MSPKEFEEWQRKFDEALDALDRVNDEILSKEYKQTLRLAVSYATVSLYDLLIQDEERQALASCHSVDPRDTAMWHLLPILPTFVK
jgi:hypothetical protein